MKRRLVILTIILVTIVAGCGFVLKSIDDSPYSILTTTGYQITDLSRYSNSQELELYLYGQFSIWTSTIQDVAMYMARIGIHNCRQYPLQNSPAAIGYVACETTAPKERHADANLLNRLLNENLMAWSYTVRFTFSSGRLVAITVSKESTGF